MQLSGNWRRRHRAALSGALLLAGCATGGGPPGSPSSPGSIGPALSAQPATAGEAAASRALEMVRDRSPLLLAFLREMPKGADLHSHLSGAVYAESFLAWAVEDGRCIRAATLAAAVGPCDADAGLVPADSAYRDADLHRRVIDSWSTRNWSPALVDGHTRFFDTFGQFVVAGRGRTGDMLAEVAARAAAGNVLYLELMLTPDEGGGARLGGATGWSGDAAATFEALRGGLEPVLAVSAATLDAAEARMRSLLRCGTADADPGCNVTVRYLYQVLRARSPAEVFAQVATGFALTQRDPRVVGLNLVQPEDSHVAMRDYSLHMAMIGFLHTRFDNVPVTLHAGELAAGLVPPEGMRFHIREAVEVAGARRIGHGVSVMHEDRPFDLLRNMADRRVLVEIALTSNDVILGVRGRDHPLHVYLAHGVPVALVTDDEGVARSDLTQEHMRAVQEQGADYRTLKGMARNSLEHAFIEGESLWRDARRFEPVAACAPRAGGWTAAGCARFAAGSPKATLQLRLERDFSGFEERWGRAR
jgi:adenosine deaminase